MTVLQTATFSPAAEHDGSAFAHSARLWLLSGGPIISQTSLTMGPLLAALGRHIRDFVMDGGTPRIETRSASWLLDSEEPTAPLTPHADPGRVRQVLFPVAAERVSFGTLWQWRQRRAEVLWFFDDGTWHEIMTEAALARQL